MQLERKNKVVIFVVFIFKFQAKVFPLLYQFHTMNLSNLNFKSKLCTPKSLIMKHSLLINKEQRIFYRLANSNVKEDQLMSLCACFSEQTCQKVELKNFSPSSKKNEDSAHVSMSEVFLVVFLSD